MKLYIDITYKAAKIDSYEFLIYPEGKRDKTVSIEISRHIDARLNDAINRAVRKLKKQAHVAKKTKPA